MTEAIDNLRRDTKNKRFKTVLADVLERVTAGRSVTEGVEPARRRVPAVLHGACSARPS